MAVYVDPLDENVVITDPKTIKMFERLLSKPYYNKKLHDEIDGMYFPTDEEMENDAREFLNAICEKYKIEHGITKKRSKCKRILKTSKRNPTKSSR